MLRHDCLVRGDDDAVGPDRTRSASPSNGMYPFQAVLRVPARDRPVAAAGVCGSGSGRAPGSRCGPRGRRTRGSARGPRTAARRPGTAVQFWRVLIANIASAVRPGVSAVHCSATPYAVGYSCRASPPSSPASRSSSPTSEMIGPCRVSRTVIFTGSSWPATLNVSSRVASARRLVVVEDAVAARTAPGTGPVTSGSRLVKPQEIALLWPITTPGRPEKLKPDTSNGHCLLDVVAVQARPASRCPAWSRRGAGRWPAAACRWWCAHRRPPTSSSRCRRRWPSSLGRPLATFSTVSSDLSRSWVSMPAPRPRCSTGAVVNLPSLTDRARRQDRLVPVVRVRRVEAVDVARRDFAASSLVRVISSSMLPPRSQAIAFSQASESAAVHGSGR